MSGPTTYGATPHGPHDILADPLFGEFGDWTPIGAVQTRNGYDFAWRNTSTGQYTVWTTDSNGNYTGNLIGAVSGNSYALKSLEPVFNQDLNGDGVIGLNPLVISSLTESPSSGDLNAGKTVTLTLNLNEAVTVAGGTPTLTLNDGGTATYTGGSGSNALTFSYTVAAGQNTVGAGRHRRQSQLRDHQGRRRQCRQSLAHRSDPERPADRHHNADHRVA